VSTVSNRQIVEELRGGMRSGVVNLMDRYHRRLIGEAIRVFRVPHQDAEELVDDVLLTVVQKIGTFVFRKGEGDFHVWVMAIFRNRVRDFMRRLALTGGLQVAFDEARIEGEGCATSVEWEVVGEIVRRYTEEAADPANSTGRGEGAMAAVAVALNALESWERVLLRCRALDVPYKEISRYTGKKAEHLKVYHARVRKKFMALVADRSGKSYE